MSTGVILLAHGSRQEEANAVFDQLVTKVKEKIDYEVVKGAVMEFAAPKLSSVVEELVGQGMKKIIIVPLFLFSGAHVKKHLPAKIEELKVSYSQVKFTIGDSLGAEEKMVELIADKTKKLAQKS